MPTTSSGKLCAGLPFLKKHRLVADFAGHARRQQWSSACAAHGRVHAAGFALGLRWSHHRIAPCRSRSGTSREDLEDLGSNFDGAPDLEFRAATKALELERSGLTYQRVPPGYRFPYGHTHATQEEVYVVVRGSGRMKLDDEIVELEEWDAVRVPPGTWRGYEAGPEGLEILVIGAPNLGDDPRGGRRGPARLVG